MHARLGAAATRPARTAPTRRSPSCSARYRSSCCSSHAPTSRTCSSRAVSRASVRSRCESRSASIAVATRQAARVRDGAARARGRYRRDHRDRVGRWSRPARALHVRLAAGRAVDLRLVAYTAIAAVAGGDRERSASRPCSRVALRFRTRCAPAPERRPGAFAHADVLLLVTQAALTVVFLVGRRALRAQPASAFRRCR